MAKANKTNTPTGEAELVQYNGQKPRTLQHWLDTYARRFNRWKRKAVKGGMHPTDANAVLQGVLDADPVTVTKNASGPLYQRFMSEQAIGADATVACIKGAMARYN